MKIFCYAFLANEKKEISAYKRHSGKTRHKIIKPLRYTEDTTSVFFVEWLRKSSVESVPKWTAAITDNASFYPKNKNRLKTPVCRHGLKALFLPPYSPDFNPVAKPGQI
ncbi:MAG: transposase [Syntrophomonadaceae bacterium]|jgi:transposase|nr:transposase [Syntrophomonadaceae bacterium]